MKECRRCHKKEGHVALIDTGSDGVLCEECLDKEDKAPVTSWDFYASIFPQFTNKPEDHKMKTKPATHTPGPWRIGDAGHTVFGPPNGNPAPEVVATIHGGTSDQAAVTRAFIMKANARLIAAAPELLAACIEAQKYIAVCFRESQGGNGGMLTANALLKSAISKAKTSHA